MSSLIFIQKDESDKSTSSGQRFAFWGCTTYVGLFILEGAMRKWLPGFSSLGYVLRDVILVAATFLAVAAGGGRKSRTTTIASFAVFGLTVLALVQTLLLAVPLAVVIPGLRSYVSPILFAYLAARFGTERWAHRIGFILIAAAPLEAILVIGQALSPPSAFLNLAGGEEATFLNSGIVRPSGSFTAPLGLALYLALTLAVSLSARGQNSFGRLARVGVISVLVAASFSGSRGTIATAGFILVFWLVSASGLRRSNTVGRRPGSVGSILVAVFCVMGLAYLAPDVANSFFDRVDSASRSESLPDRLLAQSGLTYGWNGSLLGDGLGTHSQVARQYDSSYEWIEVESAKWIAELGLLGLTLALVRLPIVLILLRRSLSRDNERGDALISVALMFQLSLTQITQFPSAQAAAGLALALLVLPIHSAATAGTTRA